MRTCIFDINPSTHSFLSHHDDLNIWAPEHMGLTPIVNPMRPNLLHPSPPTVENPHRVNNVLSLELWHSLPENDTRLPSNPQHLRSSRSHLVLSPLPWEVHGWPSMLTTLPKMIPCSMGEERAMAMRRQRPVAWLLIVTQLPAPTSIQAVTLLPPPKLGLQRATLIPQASLTYSCNPSAPLQRLAY